MLLRLACVHPLLQPLAADHFAAAHSKVHQPWHSTEFAPKGILHVRLRTPEFLATSSMVGIVCSVLHVLLSFGKSSQSQSVTDLLRQRGVTIRHSGGALKVKHPVASSG